MNYRLIKFRAWNGKKMVGVSELIFFNNGTYKINDDVESQYDGWVLMQFTGLTDKNGKEIYEGDICQAKQGEQQKPESFYQVKSKVAFWKGGFEFFGKPLSDVSIDDNGHAKNIMWCWHGHNSLPDIYEEINSIEVIGNVYETPELLK